MRERTYPHIFPALVISLILHGLILTCFLQFHNVAINNSGGGSGDGSVGVTFVTPDNVESIWRESHPPDLSPELWAKMSFGIFADEDSHSEERDFNSAHSIATRTRPKQQIPSSGKAAGSEQSTSPVVAEGKGSTGGIGTGSGSEVVRAKILNAPTPEYPESARQAGFEGAAFLKLHVSKDGRVEQVSIIESSGCKECDDNAEEIIKSDWQFSPAMVDGKTVDSIELVQVEFRLRD